MASPRGTNGLGRFPLQTPSLVRTRRRGSSSNSSSSCSGEDPRHDATERADIGARPVTTTPRDNDRAVSDSDSGSGAEPVAVTPPPRRQSPRASDSSDREDDAPNPSLGAKTLARTTSAPVMHDTAAGSAPRPRKLSVAALIRSFSPRSRAKAKESEAKAADKGGDAAKPKPKAAVPAATLGRLKRSSLSFPASPRKLKHDAQLQQQPASSDVHGRAAQPCAADPKPTTTTPSAASVSKWKQAVRAVTHDATRLRVEIPPPLGQDERAAVSADAQLATGPGSFVDDVRSALTRLLALLDAVDARKLDAIRLGGELRGLLGKAQDEFTAYEVAFRDHAASVGVAIALQNFAASLRQVFPIVERLQTAKFLLNRQFKRDVTFAFQEINSYYTSMFMELSMGVAQRAGLVLPMPVVVAPPPPPPSPEDEQDEEDNVAATPSALPEPTALELCLEAHQKFFGHGCQPDAARALDLYKQAAAQDCAVAQRCLGHMLLRGSGVEKDLFAAERWLARAAASGDAEAVYLLGCLLCEKAPHQKSAPLTRACYAQAQTHFTLAAERGLADAQFRLARLIERGVTVDDDDASDRIRRAMPWYRRAAEQNHAQAETALGRLLLLQYDAHATAVDPLGEEAAATPSHATEAIHWLQRAAASGEDAEALALLGAAFSAGGCGTTRDVDRGVAFLRRAAAAGSAEAMLRLARLLLADGKDSGALLALQDREEAHDEALRLLLAAAAQSGGTAVAGEAQHELGELLFRSPLLRDRAAALRFFVRAAQARPPHAVAARRAAAMLYAGTGCKHADKTRALRLYAVAADAADAEALNAMGLMYEEGEGCDLDFQQAAACFRRAVALGSAPAHFNLGCLLAHGKGVARNLEAAQNHFARAAALGYALARDFVRPDAEAGDRGRAC